MYYEILNFEHLAGVEPLSLPEIKNFLRVNVDIDDGFILRLYNARLRFVEEVSGKVLKKSQIEFVAFNPIHEIEVPYSKLDQVVSVYDSKGNEITDYDVLGDVITFDPVVEDCKYLKIVYNAVPTNIDELITVLLMLINYDYNSKDVFALKKVPQDTAIQKMIDNIKKVRI